MKTSNNAWTWAAYDISDEKPESEKFCAKFTSKEDFASFKEEFEKVVVQNGKVLTEMKENEGKKEEEPAEKPVEKAAEESNENAVEESTEEKQKE